MHQNSEITCHVSGDRDTVGGKSYGIQKIGEMMISVEYVMITPPDWPARRRSLIASQSQLPEPARRLAARSQQLVEGS